jgi:acetoin utilization deacetylase AcuC-like enzyme
MGSLPPDANSDQSDDAYSNAMDISHAKRHEPVSENIQAAPAIGVPAANIESNATNESYLTGETMEDDQRPVKRQKQGSSSMDVSPASPVSGTSFTVNTVVALRNADAVDVEDYSSIIHPSVAEIIKLEFIPSVEPLECLSLRDMAVLESALQFGDTHNYDVNDGWRPDWGGNLLLYDKEVVVNKGFLVSYPQAKPVKIKFCDWVVSNAQGSNDLRGLELLFRFIYNMKGTPAMAKKILAYAIRRPAESAEQRLGFILGAVQRASYDPAVLRQDGWTIKKAETPEEGEAFHIGRRIMWQRHEAIVIAFTPDETYSGLWKAAYVEDLETFDLEPGELQNATRKWDLKQKQSHKKQATTVPLPAGSTRFAATANFNVDGIEHGIILAVPTSKAAQGVLWPARVQHFIEGGFTSTGNLRRNSTKNQIQVVFLAPFWNGPHAPTSKVSDATDLYSLGPLYDFDSIEVSEYNIQRYPFDELSMQKVRAGFRFLGLPKAVFARYLDAHRLAVALKTYSIKHMSKEHASRSDDQVMASANLTESHMLSVRTPIFPQVALMIPFDFVLSNLPHPSELASTALSDDESADVDPTIDIDAIVRKMTPPACFGKMKQDSPREQILTPQYNTNPILSPGSVFTPAQAISQKDEDSLWSLNKFASDFLCGLFQTQSHSDEIDGLGYMEKLLTSLIAKLKRLSEVFREYSKSQKKASLRNLLCQCLLIKGHGEDSLECGTFPPNVSKDAIIVEWRKACERLYKRAVGKLSSQGVGNNVTSVVTDSRCNGHITNSGTFERPVRIPAAIKGAKRAGAGTDPNVLLITQVEDSFLITAEDVVIPKAHKLTYLKRIKTKIASISNNETGVPLTEDSEGDGGDDTMGSRGSFTAAVVGVAASLMAADMVVGGQCVNAFCAVRPPGHHAGREVHSMKAVSNGFCLLNAAACTALYATTPISQGGLGLRRVCVIDFDVHHGNGTQDILCPTYDPRFLYVSLHAGGAFINGYENENSDEEQFRRKIGANRGAYVGGKNQDGIFPGRCGDTSPHAGVLNIPLGQRVTASAMGAALVTQVSPKVEAFSPDLIILSAGFDAHVNDPLGMGGLSAEDFRSVTEVACQMASRSCSGRIISVLEGGYGVPCCRPRGDLFLPNNLNPDERFLDLGSDLPADMKDDIPITLRQKLDKCHVEGFLECVKEHVEGFINCNKR